MKRMAAAPSRYYEKHRRPRRTTSGYRADVCEALIPSRKQETHCASLHKLSQEVESFFSARRLRRIHIARKNPILLTA